MGKHTERHRISNKPKTWAETHKSVGKFLNRLDIFEISSEMMGIFSDSEISLSADKTRHVISLKREKGEKAAEYLERVKKACTDANKRFCKETPDQPRFSLDESGKQIIAPVKKDTISKSVRSIIPGVGPAMVIG